MSTCLALTLGLTSCVNKPAEAPPVIGPADAPAPSHLDLEDMAEAVAAIEEETGTQAGISLFDGSTDTSAGSVGMLPAWSTIKIPIAVVAQDHCSYDEETLAELTSASIEYSDNDAASSLWSCLGSDDEASQIVGEEIAKGGMSVQVGPYFGTTVWPVPAQARYARHLASLPEDHPVIDEMHKINPEHSYGLGRIPDMPFKGGWSDADDGSWHSRQMGFTTIGDTTYGIAIAARSLDGSEEDCQNALDKLAQYILDSSPTDTPADSIAESTKEQ